MGGKKSIECSKFINNKLPKPDPYCYGVDAFSIRLLPILFSSLYNTGAKGGTSYSGSTNVADTSLDCNVQT